MIEGHDFKQFSVLAAIDGFDVIDNRTGHAVDHRDERLAAVGVAWKLNTAAATGPGYLMHALDAGSRIPRSLEASP